MRLVTWNIQRGRGADGTCSLRRVVGDLKRMGEIDILCVQEISAGYTDLSGCDGSNQFVELTRLLPEYTPISGVATDTLGKDGTRRLFGNMIFSRCPVLQAFRHALPWPADASVMSMQRGALEATVDGPNGLLRISTAHLEYFSFAQRMAQVERLRELHQEASLHAHVLRPGIGAKGPFRAVPRAAAALLVGDFNLLPESPEYTRLHAPFSDAGTARLYDAWHLLHPGQLHAPTVCVHDRPDVPAAPLTFDYVFISDDLRARARQIRVVTDIVGPDHQPLLFEFD